MQNRQLKNTVFQPEDIDAAALDEKTKLWLLNLINAEKNANIQSQLLYLFQKIINFNLNLDYLQDWMSIYHFMLHTELVEPYLYQLESELQAHANLSEHAVELEIDEYDNYHLPSGTKQARRFKILSSYLYQWAELNGFNGKAKIIKALDIEPFCNLLLNQFLIKDTAGTIGQEHGVWSHALQWYAIMKYQQKTGFLQHEPVAVYREFGVMTEVMRTKQSITIWDIILDQTNADDFSSPEYMTRTISHMMKRPQWPLLFQTVKRTQEKLNYKFGSPGKYTEYLTQKHQEEMVDGVVAVKFK